ncbi:hypothetical protein Tco_0588982 [Tanacetum coccineum]
MAQSQRQADVHKDELCPTNKQYALMDSNKKIDLDKPLCPNESTIMVNILQNHPLISSIAASSSVPWINLGTIFQLPQATDNNHEHFFVAPKFSKMVPFFLNNLGFTLKLRSPSNFKTTGLEGLYYSLEHLSTLIPYPRFTKLIMGHYMTAYLKISRRLRDKYHNLEHDEMVKSIFNSGKNKARVGMKIPSWMITDEMQLKENYRMYVEAFWVDVPTTQSQPIESTQGTHRTTSGPLGHLTLMWMKENQEIEKMVEGTENVDADEFVSFILNSQNDRVM